MTEFVEACELVNQNIMVESKEYLCEFRQFRGVEGLLRVSRGFFVTPSLPFLVMLKFMKMLFIIYSPICLHALCFVYGKE